MSNFRDVNEVDFEDLIAACCISDGQRKYYGLVQHYMCIKTHIQRTDIVELAQKCEIVLENLGYMQYYGSGDVKLWSALEHKFHNWRDKHLMELARQRGEDGSHF
jgi:hypothetical protein